MNWIIITLVSALFFAFSHILKKKILLNAEVLHMMIPTYIIGFLLMLPIIEIADCNISSRNLIMILTNAILAFAGSYLLNIAYKGCQISSVSPLLNINPLFIMALSHCTLGEIVNGMQLLGVLFILIGGYTATLEDIRDSLKPFTSLPGKYFLMVLLALVLWAFMPLIHKIVLREIRPLSYLFYFALFMCSIHVILLTKSNTLNKILVLLKHSWLPIAAISLFWVISDFFHLYAIAVPTVMVSLVIPIKRISSLFIVILGGNLFKEKNLTAKTLACSIMILGLFIIGCNS
jgi:uncharacterized membrane protein